VKYLLQISYKKSSINKNKPLIGVLLPDDTKQMPISRNLLVQRPTTHPPGDENAKTFTQKITKSSK